ncbi:CapA family protein [Thomasclavelia cocleata]|uniref:CapA family protein n=1 Tax=Thomasclavelia cocleata TaxID=69824 RepID=UPI00272E1993|nr:CapA family protein [Thomasclavelia cocleata]
MNEFKIKAVSMVDNRVLLEKGNKLSVENGLGNVLFLDYILGLISHKKLKLNQEILIRSSVHKISKGEQVVLRDGDYLTLYKLLVMIINFNSNAALLSIAEFLDPSRKQPSIKVKEKRKHYGLEREAAINITGRKMSKKQQLYSIDDLILVGKKMVEKFQKDLAIYNASFLDYQSTIYENNSFLNIQSNVKCAYLFGLKNQNGFILVHIHDEPVLVAVIGARNAFHRDFILQQAIDDMKSCPQYHETQPVVFQGTKSINFLGDTYFGEFYTNRRIKKNRKDALICYGYDYSLDNIKDFFRRDDYNILNFEAVFVDENEKEKSWLKGQKPFLLWANQNKTMRALSKLNLNAVSLGNNHAMDFGSQNLLETISAFNKDNIKVFGAGKTSSNAVAPIHLKINGRNIYIYSGYWYRKNAYRRYDFYTMGSSAGVAPLDAICDEIEDKKEADPNCFIIVQPHWGVDFKSILPYQVENAEALVHSGCDLIIGHGPHTIQKVRKYREKLILYSIGNGVFNSDGEFSKYGALAYGFLTRLKFESDGAIKLILTPFNANNLETFWRPEIVNGSQFNEIIESLKESTNYMYVDRDARQLIFNVEGGAV